MPGMDGIETAHHLNTFDPSPAIVFTTAYDEYAIDAFEANAIGYVLKPVRRERLDQALSQAARLTSSALFDAGKHYLIGIIKQYNRQSKTKTGSPIIYWSVCA